MSRHLHAPKYVHSVYPTLRASTDARLSVVRVRHLSNPPKEVRRTARCKRRVHYLRSSSNRVPWVYCQTSRLVSGEFLHCYLPNLCLTPLPFQGQAPARLVQARSEEEAVDSSGHSSQRRSFVHASPGIRRARSRGGIFLPSWYVIQSVSCGRC